MDAVEPHFVIKDAGIGIDELHLTGSQALHFTSHEDNAGFEYVENLVVMSSFSIARKNGVR